MYDAGKIIPGLIVFIGLATVPVWYNAGTEESGDRPELTLPQNADKCVADLEFMRTDHMNLLNEWRDRVARDGERYVEIDGVQTEMSLTNTCMGCHDDKAAFCDRCHDYLGVVPYCWDCHLTPEVIEKWE